MTFDWHSLIDYSEVIDVRTPAEYALDHIPAAINLPVLDNAERVLVGKLYRDDAFAGRRTGMGLVAANLAHMAATTLANKEPQWQPLVYCWRGGMRSASVVEIMRKVGWEATALPGGYQAYRSHVRTSLLQQPNNIAWHVLCGPTGSGKTLLLAELAKQGAQVIDLEGLANHRGSVFGDRGIQPGQKLFESQLLAVLVRLESTRPVFIESESHAIGKIRVPPSLLNAMHASTVVRIVADLDARAQLSVRDYSARLDEDSFQQIVKRLSRYISKATITRWRELWHAGELLELAKSLLAEHYDCKYLQSLTKHYDFSKACLTVELVPVNEASVHVAARTIIARCG